MKYWKLLINDNNFQAPKSGRIFYRNFKDETFYKKATLRD